MYVWCYKTRPYFLLFGCVANEQSNSKLKVILLLIKLLWKIKKIATFEYNYYLKFCNRQNTFFHYIWLIIRLFQNVMAANLNIKQIWLKCTSLKCLISMAYWLLNVCVIFGPWLIEHLLAVKSRLQASLSFWIPPTEALWNMLIFDICSNNVVEHVLLVKNTQFQA